MVIVLVAAVMALMGGSAFAVNYKQGRAEKYDAKTPITFIAPVDTYADTISNVFNETPFETPDTVPTDVAQYGADGSDNQDDTAALQKALDTNDAVTIPNGTYYINVDNPLRLQSNQTLTLSDDTVLKAMPTSSSVSSVLVVENATNVTITGGTIVGERSEHTGAGGEWGMGILITGGAENVMVSNLTITDCWGDGIYVGGTPIVRNVTIDNVIGDGNRRQGLSVTNASGVIVTNSVFKNTSGTAPAAGIDLEPNEGELVENVTIIGVTCTGNQGGGLDLMGWLGTIRAITVTDSNFANNGESGLYLNNVSGVTVSDTIVSGNYWGVDMPRDVTDVRFERLTVRENAGRGVSLITTEQSSGTSGIVFDECIFASNSRSAANNSDGVRIDNYDTSGYLHSVSFTGCEFLDDQQNATQRFGLTVSFSGNLRAITIDTACVFSGNITGDYLGGNVLSVV